ncbi:MAG: hypothetical protein WD749_01460 [Phycisphaerales bacterium]
MSISGHFADFTAGGTLPVGLQIRRVLGTGNITFDANDSMSWNLTVYRAPCADGSPRNRAA